jgi:uncharacterized protein with HEPN domain
MALKKSGNKWPDHAQKMAYVDMLAVSTKSEVEEERLVALAVGKSLRVAIRTDQNETDAIMQSLSRIEEATKRIRAEMRAIHG